MDDRLRAMNNLPINQTNFQLSSSEFAEWREIAKEPSDRPGDLPSEQDRAQQYAFVIRVLANRGYPLTTYTGHAVSDMGDIVIVSIKGKPVRGRN